MTTIGIILVSLLALLALAASLLAYGGYVVVEEDLLDSKDEEAVFARNLLVAASLLWAATIAGCAWAWWPW